MLSPLHTSLWVVNLQTCHRAHVCSVASVWVTLREREWLHQRDAAWAWVTPAWVTPAWVTLRRRGSRPDEPFSSTLSHFVSLLRVVTPLVCLLDAGPWVPAAGLPSFSRSCNVRLKLLCFFVFVFLHVICVKSIIKLRNSTVLHSGLCSLGT